jgi:hypothetical protein
VLKIGSRSVQSALNGGPLGRPLGEEQGGRETTWGRTRREGDHLGKSGNCGKWKDTMVEKAINWKVKETSYSSAWMKQNFELK